MMGFEGGDFRRWLRLHEVIKVEPHRWISALNTRTSLPVNTARRHWLQAPKGALSESIHMNTLVLALRLPELCTIMTVVLQVVFP